MMSDYEKTIHLHAMQAHLDKQEAKRNTQAVPESEVSLTILEQRENKIQMKPKPITIKGVTRTQSQWAKRLGVSREAIRIRVAYGWKPEEIATRRGAIKHRRYLMPHRRTDDKVLLYRRWVDMHRRCYNHKSISYKDYGARGIRVCEQWNRFDDFFDWAIGNGYKSGLILDRIDNNGDYEPSNCRFSTNRQSANNKRNTVRIEYNGEEKTMTEWADTVEADYSSFRAKVKRVGIAETLLNPPKRYRKRRRR